MSEEIDDIVKDFAVDTYETLVRVDRDLVELEAHPSELEIITRVFRAIHTIKGVCGFLSYPKLRDVCHAGESLLSCLRDSRLAFTPEIANALLNMVDAIRQILACIEADRNEGTGDYSGVIANLTRLFENVPPASAPVAKSGSLPLALTKSAPVVKAPVAPVAAVVPATAEPAQEASADPWSAPPSTAPVPPIEHVVTPVAAPAPAPVPPTQAHVGGGGGGGAGSGGPPAPGGGGDEKGWDRGIRVDIDLLDKLMTLVGELVLARNQIMQITQGAGNSHNDSLKESHGGARLLQTATQRLDGITSELQEGVMKTRMQPIGVLWSRFPRLIRDLALSLGKEVKVSMEGMDTELDKTLVEAIKDPLTHLVRNSVDHGIEFPGAREAVGKSREGHLKLNAFHVGGFVNIEISDDGAGVNFERVRAKAVKSGLLTADHAARLGYKDVINLLFLPGFSTAERVTDISGRGVGMDVVKTNIERIGGTIEIDTNHGQGTTITVKVPLTLAIIPALMVDCGGERFAIPQSTLVELLHIDEDQRAGRIEMMHGTPVYRLRKRLLPLVFLHRLLGLGTGSNRTENLNIVVLQASGQTFGLVVDAVRDTEEIVVKPLSQQLQHLSYYGGATILGDGRIALILEVLGLAAGASIAGKLDDPNSALAAAKAEEAREATQSVLLFWAGESGHMAVPLDKVTRLEAFERDTVESSGGQYAVQYRGDILRLVRLEDALPGYAPPQTDSELMHVLVYSFHGQSIGIIIGRIMDIVEVPIKLQSTMARPGVIGTAVVLGRITEFLDIEYVIRMVDPSLFAAVSAEEASAHV